MRPAGSMMTRAAGVGSSSPPRGSGGGHGRLVRRCATDRGGQAAGGTLESGPEITAQSGPASYSFAVRGLSQLSGAVATANRRRGTRVAATPGDVPFPPAEADDAE